MVVKAYRTFCDSCAQQKHVCPGCGGKLDDPSAASEDVVLDEDEMMREDDIVHGQSKITKMPRREATSSVSSSAVVSTMETDAHEEPPSEATTPTATSDSAVAAADAGIARGGEWDARKYHGIATTKYSKNRVVGASNDTVFSWGEAAEASEPLPASEATGDVEGAVDA